MKRMIFVSKPLFGIVGLFSLFLTFQSCIDDLSGTIPVIQGELVGEYLEKNPELFSEFTRMLDTTGVMGLLKAYGIYTVFAPTDSAVYRYYRTLKDENGNYTITSMNQLSLKDIKEFCYNHIIKGDTIKTKMFKDGAMGSQSMSERFLTVSFVSGDIVINGESKIVTRDIEKHNGLIHVLDECLSPAHIKIGECFEADSLRFSIYIDALRATGLYSIMNKALIEDETYDYKMGFAPNTTDEFNPEDKPKSRKFGYTILAVSNEDLKNSKYPHITDVPAGLNLADGIDNINELEALAKYYYSRQFGNDANLITDRTNPKNYLNRFMSYHCFDRILLGSRFIKDLFTPNNLDQYPMRDYIETMLENTIIEVLLDKQGNVVSPSINNDPRSAFGVFNYDDPVQGAMITDVKDLPRGGSLNGYYHGITRPIMYTSKLAGELSSKRLRIDGAAFFPELATNNMRGSNPTASADKRPRAWVIDDNYLDKLESSPNTRFTYVGACEWWENHQGDMYMVRGNYNFTLKTIPIPAGTYEVRFGFKSTEQRGIAQLYLDSMPCGIPLDLAIPCDNVSIGYEKPGSNEDDPLGFENDKMLHNRGYMKGGSSYRCSNGKYWSPNGERPNARLSNLIIRKVLGIFTFDETKKHYFTAISLGSNSTKPIEFQMDYLEFCPIEILDREDTE
jgi:uncharacterized surface protein with fasciclin (FAS1) repeats